MVQAQFRPRKALQGAGFTGGRALLFMATLGFAIFLISRVLGPMLSAQESKEPIRRGQANLETTEPETSGAVEGLVTFHGEIPKSPTPDDAGVKRELLEVDRKTRGLRYVVAYLTPVNGASDRQPASAIQKPRVTADQQDYAFVPRVVAVQEGEPVTFTNSDPANHNVRAFSAVTKNEFNVFTGAGGKYEHRFAADPQRRPIRLGCDIHPWMRGWIYVVDHPHFAVTDERGAFRIGSVPPGEYKLVLQQPDIRYTHEQSITVSNKQPVKVEIEVRAEHLSKPKE